MSKTAVVIMTHFLDQSILNMFDRIRTEASSRYDVFISLNLGDSALCAPKEAASIGQSLFLCNHKKLLELPYPEKCRPEGWKSINNLDTIVLSFQREHPGYEFYWGIEYDVHYEGKWGFLFERFETSKADLLGLMLDTASKARHKIDVLLPPFRDPAGKRPDCHEAVVGFYPLHRVSKRMLHKLDESYRQGWNGHNEFTWGTIAKRHQLEIEDIGGSGPYVKAHNRNVFYFNTISRWDLSPGTFVFRPGFAKVPKRENTLWHPIKPKGDYLVYYPASRGENLYGRAKHISKSIFYTFGIWIWFRFRWRPATSSPIEYSRDAAA